MRADPHFLTRLEMTPRADGVTWKLDRPFSFLDAYRNIITVPSGFVTDLASIPKLFWNILPPFGKYTEAAVIHDWIYRTHLFPRWQCDAILNEGMIACGVGFWTRAVIYLNVRAFGWLAWRDERRWKKHIPVHPQKI